MSARGHKTFSLEELEDAINEGGIGFCIACGEQSDNGVEPDAENYECDSCGRPEVYGAEQILIMGLVS